MSLAVFEQDLVDKIYEILISDDNNKGITLYGDIGSGKSTVAISLANQLIEGWSVFYIEGIDSNLSPYLTWHIGTKLHSKKKINLGSNISFGISFLPVPVSLQFGASASVNSLNYLLSPSEEAIITNIKKQTGDNRKVLFIADNYEMWDTPSKQLLQKIMHPQIGLLTEYHLNVLLITQNKQAVELPVLWEYISMPNIPDESLLHILREHGYAKHICIQDIRACAGNDLSLALMAAHYYAENGENANDFIEIMDRRCENLPTEKQEVRKVLGSLSIIDSCFSKDEVAFFLDSTSKDNYEVEYLAEEYIQEAEEQHFIKGDNKFLFTSNRIKEYFKAKIVKKERYYHRKFYEFLQKKHPEDYYSRGKHLSLSIQLSDTKIIVEAWQLLLLAYFRRSSETGSHEDVYKILDEIESLINTLPTNSVDVQRNVLKEFTLGYKYFSNYKYKEALLHLESITPSRLIPACLAECQRLILLCRIQLSDDTRMTIQCADELYNTIENVCQSEDEQYCRAALVLLDAYIDRSNDHIKVNVLKNQIIQIIQNHMGVPEFEEFEACYNRKSALYYAALVAYRQTEQSVIFYKKQCNRNGTYMSLCNHSGNAIVSGQYLVANDTIKECISLLNDNDGWYYPSQYKIHNNRILLDYLINEEKAHGDRIKILDAARKSMSSFSDLIEYQFDEVSYVVFFNYLGLSILCQTDKYESEIMNANRMISELDEYYKYYLYDLNYATALFRRDVAKADEYLSKLKKLDAPLLRHYRMILQKRQQVQEDLLSSQIIYTIDPFDYHSIIHSECSHIQDNSCNFWGRGFLLSDLQFLSF